MYYALYRKYRPLSFGDVLGQEAITTTLRRQVATGQISHAYLFTGTRGTGKTTCAKILARAVNCLNPKEGDPCNECAICKGLLDGTLYDVEEIDAASNNGVENIRQIREEVVYAPTAARYKVYIIDEVHMLSAGAFNALLKTLEEPPSHAIFILATTEIHKVPATILSRCQRFDFLRIPKSILMEQFRDILKKEGKALEENALDLVAELADGSSRDGLSILDKVIDLETFEQVESVLGVIPKQQIYQLLFAAARQDTDAMYRAVEDLYNASADLGRLCTDMMSVMKDVMIFRSAKNPAALLEKSESDFNALTELSALYPTERILYSLKVLQATVARLPFSSDKRTDAEVCMLRLSRPDLEPKEEELAARLATVEQELREWKEKGVATIQVSSPITATPPVFAAPPVSQQPATAPETKPTEEKPQTAPSKKPPVFEDPFANPSVASAGKYVEPEEYKPTASAKTTPPTVPKPPKAPTDPSRIKAEQPVVPTAQSSGDNAFQEGWQTLDAWRDIAHTVSRTNRILGFLLESTPAVYQGRTILVLAEDKEDYREIKSPDCMDLIREALKENRKEGYQLRIENCSPDKYIPNASIDQLKKENLFDFGDYEDEEIPQYDE